MWVDPCDISVGVQQLTNIISVPSKHLQATFNVKVSTYLLPSQNEGQLASDAGGGITMSHLSLKGLSGSSRKGHLPHLSLVSFNEPRLSSVLMSSYTVLNLYKYVPDFAEWKEWKMDFAFLTLHSLRGQGLLYDLLLVGLLRHIITQGDLDNQCCCILPISVTAVRQSKPRGNCSSR